jgi:hypothetical protein
MTNSRLNLETVIKAGVSMNLANWEFINLLLFYLQVRTIVYDGDADYILNFNGVEAMVGILFLFFLSKGGTLSISSRLTLCKRNSLHNTTLLLSKTTLCAAKQLAYLKTPEAFLMCVVWKSSILATVSDKVSGPCLWCRSWSSSLQIRNTWRRRGRFADVLANHGEPAFVVNLSYSSRRLAIGD